MKPSEQSPPENWSKFLKELQDPQVQAILGHDPVKEFNRAAARKHGFPSAQELEAKIMEKRKLLQEFREFTCGKWIHEQLQKHLWKWLLKRTISKGPVLARVFGWYWGAENKPQFAANGKEMPKLYPSTHVYLAHRWPRFWFPRAEDNKIKFTFWGPLIVVEQQMFHWNEESTN